MNRDAFVASLYADGRMKTALIPVTGSKYYSCIWPDSSGMRVRRVPLRTHLAVQDYPISKAKKVLRRCCRNFGSTIGVRRLLRG